MSSPQVATTIRECRDAVREARNKGQRIGLVPTMGALHEGHLSLVDASREQCNFHVASIFVNPTQFGEGEDLDRYPRTFDADLAALAERGIDLVFAPSVGEMYPTGYSTYVDPPSVANRLEGEHRPVHFRGVTSVVLKLFNAVAADVAFFGEKDFQQCLVVQHMVRDLNIGVEIHPCAIVREADGLAMSSRNRYLTDDERRRALCLSYSLSFVETEFASGDRSAKSLEEKMMDRLRANTDSIDYAVVVDADTLDPIESSIDRPAVALIAAFVGRTRLIDNRRLN